jgi:hypothetical protein
VNGQLGHGSIVPYCAGSGDSFGSSFNAAELMQ